MNYVFKLPNGTPLKVPRDYNYQLGNTYVAFLPLVESMKNMRYVVGISKFLVGKMWFEFGFILSPSVLGTKMDISSLFQVPDFLWYNGKAIEPVVEGGHSVAGHSVAGHGTNNGVSRSSLAAKIEKAMTINEHCFLNKQFRATYAGVVVDAYGDLYDALERTRKMWNYLSNNNNVAVTRVNLVKSIPWDVPRLCEKFFEGIRNISPNIDAVVDDIMTDLDAGVKKLVADATMPDQWLPIERDYYLVVVNPVDHYINNLVITRCGGAFGGTSRDTSRDTGRGTGRELFRNILIYSSPQ